MMRPHVRQPYGIKPDKYRKDDHPPFKPRIGQKTQAYQRQTRDQQWYHRAMHRT